MASKYLCVMISIGFYPSDGATDNSYGSASRFSMVSMLPLGPPVICLVCSSPSSTVASSRSSVLLTPPVACYIIHIISIVYITSCITSVISDRLFILAKVMVLHNQINVCGWVILSSPTLSTYNCFGGWFVELYAL